MLNLITNLQIQEKQFKIPSNSEEIIHFLLSMHEGKMRLICIHVAVQKHGYSKRKCHNFA